MTTSDSVEHSLRGQCFLVTGGGGFVGKALIKELVLLGAKVKSLARGDYPELHELGVQCFEHDLSTEQSLDSEILAGVSGIFHTAAYVKMWGDPADFLRTNVLGTRKLVAAAKKAGVSRFVFTSSPSVIADGSNLKNVDESYPYPSHYEAEYPKTKAMAEREVLASNSEQFFTCSLRPHLIFGPGDTNLIPTVIKRAEAGSLKQIGDGENLVDFTYIDDCVAAHLCAMEALGMNSNARGRAYFISQGEPYPLWQWINEVLEYRSLPPVKNSVSPKVAMMVATLCERLSRVLPFVGEPRFTRFLVSEMATDHYFDISAAKKELRFNPQHSVSEALQRTFEEELILSSLKAA